MPAVDPPHSIDSPGRATILLLTALAMLAFAANSVLCRLALRETGIDPVSFTAVRLVAGAVALSLLVRLRGRRSPARPSPLPWRAAFALFAYALCFSIAYVRLPAATGALLLFGAVQATMIGRALWTGERPGPIQTAGYILAAAGLLGMLLPGLTAPPLAGAAMMLAAGVAWGIYSVLGKRASDNIAANAGSFVRAAALSIPVCLLMVKTLRVDLPGVGYAVLSGAIASGMGYAVWYAALRGLTVSAAGLVQLSVPVIAAIGGVLLLHEPVTWRLVAASIAVLGGVALGMRRRQ